jgi:hypothetical protein
MKKLLMVITFLIGFSTFCQENINVDVVDYVREVQIWQKHGNNMSFTFWIPTSYWEIALKDSPSVRQEDAQYFASLFQDYVFICALDFEINTNTTMIYTQEQDLRNSISIVDSKGKKYFPLENDQLSEEVYSVSELLSPMFAQMLGQMGEGMHFYFFEIKDKQGNNIIDEYTKGEFTIKHSNHDFKFQLPLVCLLPPKTCPIDGAEMKGNWNYCPFHGKKLEKG